MKTSSKLTVMIVLLAGAASTNSASTLLDINFRVRVVVPQGVKPSQRRLL